MRNPTFVLAGTVLALSSCLPSLVFATQAQNGTSQSTNASPASGPNGKGLISTADTPVTASDPTAKNTTGAAVTQDSPSTLNCSTYTNANAANATCNDDSSRVCTGKCTGAVSIDKCYLKSETGPFSEEKCTISYGKSSATIYICTNEKGSFSCTGQAKGSATCSGCTSKSSNSSSSGSTGNSTAPPSTGGSTNGTSTGTGGNGSTTPDKPASASRLALAGPVVATTGLLAGLMFF